MHPALAHASFPPWNWHLAPTIASSRYVSRIRHEEARCPIGGPDYSSPCPELGGASRASLWGPSACEDRNPLSQGRQYTDQRTHVDVPRSLQQARRYHSAKEGVASCGERLEARTVTRVDRSRRRRTTGPVSYRFRGRGHAPAVAYSGRRGYSSRQDPTVKLVPTSVPLLLGGNVPRIYGLG